MQIVDTPCKPTVQLALRRGTALDLGLDVLTEMPLKGKYQIVRPALVKILHGSDVETSMSASLVCIQDQLKILCLSKA
jgi:hypothetical protein